METSSATNSIGIGISLGSYTLVTPIFLRTHKENYVHRPYSHPSKETRCRHSGPCRCRPHKLLRDRSGPHYHYDCKITNKVLTGPTPVKTGNAGKASKAGKAGKAGKDEISPEKALQIIRQYVEKDLQSKIRVAYDGENNMYSYAKLSQDKLVSEVTLKSPSGSSDVYKIVLELVNTNPMDALNNYLRGVPPADSDKVAQS
ncbi:hypothetical protein BC936DRAFT_139112 [Jimgerdemannia flammicorona]|uniref:Protein argonaute N-terminal domain-containing protein n=1 Tax=Jimgerdemannia flammicorona TaxID=994334 RepID=A0A433BAM4_9FUNG|nr:hypothetical protein BC936DRAFT_139112 [Jimgerdemannia flammicorona]